MKQKIFRLLLYLSLSSCSGCVKEPKEEPQDFPPIDLIEVLCISEKQAKDPNFWQQCTIGEEQTISHIRENIKSDFWREHETILISLTLFLCSKSNVKIFNTYRDQNTLGKLLFFIAQAINSKQNIDKYLHLFLREFIRRLKESHPDDYEIILQNPVKIEEELRGMIIDDVHEKNPDSVGKVRKYKSVLGHDLSLHCRTINYIPPLSAEMFLDPFTFSWIWILPKGEVNFQKYILSEREKFLQTQKEPSTEILYAEINEAIKEITKRVFGNSSVEPRLKNISKIGELFKKLIKEGMVNFINVPQDKLTEIFKDKDRFHIEANDVGYHETFGNEDLEGVRYCSINLVGNEFQIKYPYCMGYGC
ncbi:MAG: hypothetical protein LBD41_00045 [Clostridiales Family XIII bacterium]|jgi:hypothetical protein|nr:hypothetical protein [Clostridiales Family XIII bacterium]